MRLTLLLKLLFPTFCFGQNIEFGTATVEIMEPFQLSGTEFESEGRFGRVCLEVFDYHYRFSMTILQATPENLWIYQPFLAGNTIFFLTSPVRNQGKEPLSITLNFE